MLYCTVPYHTVPCYTILYHTILYYSILYYTIPYHTYCTVVHSTVLYYTTLHYTILYLYCITNHWKSPAGRQSATALFSPHRFCFHHKYFKSKFSFRQAHLQLPASPFPSAPPLNLSPRGDLMFFISVVFAAVL